MMLLGGALVAVLDHMHWPCFLAYEGIMTLAYLSLETAWSRSTLGISGVPETTP